MHCPPTARDAAGAAWRDYGEVIVVRQPRGSRAGIRPLRVRASRGACAGSRLVARESHVLRLAVPRRGDDGRVRRQGVRSEPRPADHGRGALLGRALGAQVHQDGDLAAHDARGQSRRSRRPPRASRGSKAWKRTRAPPTTGSQSIFPTSASSSARRSATSRDCRRHCSTSQDALRWSPARAPASDARLRWRWPRPARAVVLVARREAELARCAARNRSSRRPRCRDCRGPRRSRSAACDAPRAQRRSSVRPTSSSMPRASTSASPMLEVSRADWDAVLAINLTAPFFLAQALGAGDDRERVGTHHQHRVAAIGARVSRWARPTVRRRAVSRS